MIRSTLHLALPRTGVNLFSYLDADRSRIQALFDLAARLSELVGPIAQLHMGPDQAE